MSEAGGTSVSLKVESSERRIQRDLLYDRAPRARSARARLRKLSATSGEDLPKHRIVRLHHRRRQCVCHRPQMGA